MIIKSIELENIRSYKKEFIQFDTGINFLSGDIGSGKSSILLAIEFALFGFKRGDLEGFQLLRKGEITGNIKLTLFDTKTGKEVEICRNIKKSTSNNAISQQNGYVCFDENIIEMSPSELNDYVFKILSFPKEFLTKDKNLIYRFTIYTPQEQLKEILFAPSEQRLEVIRKIFNIDKYKQLKDALSIYCGKMREDKKIYQSKLDNVDKLKCEIKNFENENVESKKKLDVYLKKENEFFVKCEKCKDAVQKRDEKLIENMKYIMKLEKEISKLDEISRNVNKLKEDYEIKAVKLKKVSDGDYLNKLKDANKIVLAQKDKLLEIIKRKKLLENELVREKKILEDKDLLNKKVSELNSIEQLITDKKQSFDIVLTKCQIKDLENDILKNTNLIKKFRKISEEIEELKIVILKDENFVENLNLKIEENNKIIINLSNVDTCNFCKQVVSSEHKIEMKKKIKDEIKNIKEEIAKFNESLKRNKRELLKQEKEVQDFDEIHEQLLKQEERLNNLLEREAKEKELIKKIKQKEQIFTKRSIDDFKKELEKLEIQIKMFENTKQQLSELQREELEITNSISELKVKIEKISNLISDKDMLVKEIDKIDKEIKSLSEELKLRDNINSKLSEYKKIDEKVKSEKEQLSLNVEKLNNNLRIISNSSTSLKTSILNNQKFLNMKNKELEELKIIEKHLEKLLEIEMFLTKDVVNISSEIEKVLFTKYYVDFNEEFEKLFRELIEDNEIDIRLDSEFSPVIEQNGYDIDIKNLSGGERSSLAIAYRLGLKNIIENSLAGEQKLSLLILDEPTDGFSNEQIARLGNILKLSNLKQIILVSHDEKIESIADNVLKIEKINHVSVLE